MGTKKKSFISYCEECEDNEEAKRKNITKESKRDSFFRTFLTPLFFMREEISLIVKRTIFDDEVMSSFFSIESNLNICLKLD